jgi:hypothetical protein
MGWTLPPPKDLGSQLGQAIGGGLERGLNTSLNTQYERGLLQNALNQAKTSFNDPNASVTDKMFALMQAGAGIPGSEKYLSTLLPELIRGTVTNNAFGQNGPGLQNAFNSPKAQNPSQSIYGHPLESLNNPNSKPTIIPENVNPNTLGKVPIPQREQYNNQSRNNNAPEQNNLSIPQRAALSSSNALPPIPQGTQTPEGQAATLGGQPVIPYGGRPAEEIEDIAKQMTVALRDPNMLPVVTDFLQKINREKEQQAKNVYEAQQQEQLRQKVILDQDQQLRDYATKNYKRNGATVSGDDLNDFMRVGQQFSNLSPSDWLAKTSKEFEKYYNAKTTLTTIPLPGVFRGLFLGGEEREKDLKKLGLASQMMVKYGKEDLARDQLAEGGLTPTEIEQQVRPLDNSMNEKIDSLPKSYYPLDKGETEFVGGTPFRKKVGDEKLQNPLNFEKGVSDLTNFILQNGGGNSLLAMRDKLIRDKDYSWEQFHAALNRAVQQGYTLNNRQDAELGQLSQPPRDAMASIFRGWGNIVDYLKGAR